MNFQISSFLISFFIIYSLFSVLAKDNCEIDIGLDTDNLEKDEFKELKYEAPGTLTFPVGDEPLTNDEHKQEINNENSIVNKTREDLNNAECLCEDRKMEQSFEKPLAPLHCCDEGHTTPSKICLSCNINLAPTGEGVVITCHNCTDLKGQPVNLDASFFADFIEMSGFGHPQNG